ncbi:MAG: hypothetical protein K2O95_02585, partial [Clostridia bacterium]|nr:hypothetical protein [Clostridia bacterium]
MKAYQSQKGKIAVRVLAVMLIACMLTISMTGCNSSEIGVTPIDVFFVGNMQQNVADTSDLMKEGTELVSVNDMLTTEGWTLEANTYDVIAGIYALAVTNYNNVNRSAYMVMTDASVNAFKCSRLGNKDVNVGIRSTYSAFMGENGSFSQTISGVTILDGLGGFVSNLRDNFGWNTQTFNNDKFEISKKGFNAGAQFYGEGNNSNNATKYIMGAGNPKLDKASKFTGSVKSNNSSDEDEDVPERDYAWSQLLPIEGDPLTVAGTSYNTGTYGAGWATSNYSVAEYFDTNKTKIDYIAELDLYVLDITILSEYVDEACEFTKGGLVKDTKDYIELNNAKYTESTARIEVYGSGLIKSMQKIDTLESNETCKLSVAGGMFGSCDEGGKASNRITMAFGYDKDDCDALKYVALYWPELATETPYKKAEKGTLKNVSPLNLSNYTTFSNYKPKANELVSKFNPLFSLNWADYALNNEE